MLRLRSCVLAHLLSSPTTSHGYTLRRLLSATTAAPAVTARTGFAVEAYLVDTCGLTRAQALKASAKLSHLKSPAKPDAVLKFLADHGLSSSDITAVVARDPLFLCASVERTLSPIVDGLAGLGLSRSEIARLVPLAALPFRSKSVVSKVVKRNVELLQECTLGACEIVKLAVSMPRMLTANAERIRAMVASAEGLGVPRSSGMFRQAMRSVAFDSEEKIAAKMEYLKKTFRWSDAEVRIAVSKGSVGADEVKGHAAAPV